jgi:hypothetical protein
MPPEEVARLGNVRLVPGMPVEAFVKMGERTVMSSSGPLSADVREIPSVPIFLHRHRAEI